MHPWEHENVHLIKPASNWRYFTDWFGICFLLGCGFVGGLIVGWILWGGTHFVTH